MRQLGPGSLATILFLSFGLVLTEIAPAPPAAAQTAHPKLVLTSRPTAPLVPKAPDPSLVTVAPPGSALYVAKRGDSIPLVAHKYLAQTSYLTSSELTEAIHKANERFPQHFPEGGPAGDHPRDCCPPRSSRSRSRSTVILKFGRCTSPESWRPATTEYASSSTGGKSAATPLSSISRTAMERHHSLRSSAAWSSSQRFPRSAQVHSLPAFAEHARHRAHRDVPRPAAGGDPS